MFGLFNETIDNDSIIATNEIMQQIDEIMLKGVPDEV